MIGSIIGGVTALGSAIYGGIKSSAENNKARRLIQQQRDDNKAWYEKKMSDDYTMRSDVQAAVNKQRALLNEQLRNARATNTVAGGTAESLALQQKQAVKSVSDTMTDVAAEAAAHKDAIENQYRATDAALNQQQAQSHQQQAAQVATAAGQAVGAGINMLGNELGKIKKTKA